MEIARTMRTINRKLTSLNISDNKITNDDVEALTEVRDMILTNQVKRERDSSRDGLITESLVYIILYCGIYILVIDGDNTETGVLLEESVWQGKTMMKRTMYCTCEEPCNASSLRMILSYGDKSFHVLPRM